ncbi:MAG: tetratricopeptide repeat protein [Bacteroidetes bacterium]|nr:tetratricopeptide repeat protein [Bacteroidota bacterium]
MNERMHVYGILTVCFLLALPAALAAQSYRSTVNDGNEQYHEKKFDDALQKYEAAAVTEPERPESYFNSGNASYRAFNNPEGATDPKMIERALKEYERAGMRFRDREKIAGTLYNAGNVFLAAAEKGGDNPALQQATGGEEGDLRKEGYRQAIEMYKKSLKLDPSDADARYNLTYAKKKLEELEQQQQNQDKNQDQKQQQKQDKQDKQQDQQNQDKNKQEEQQKQDKQDQQQQQQQNQKDDQQQEKAKPEEQQQPQQQEQQMSKQQAEQILRALQREEKELQKKKRQQQGRRVNVEKDW